MIQFTFHSGVYILEAKQLLNTTMEEAWKLLSDPLNLEKLTPRSMDFQITSGAEKSLYAGQIISYKVSPFAGFRTNWVTEITHVVQGQYFIDEQRFGPYSMWHHEHHLESTKNGVMMIDKVVYKLPMGIAGRLFHSILVKKQLTDIFQYREQQLEAMFNQ